MQPVKDPEFWNALKRSKRVRRPVLGWLVISIGIGLGATGAWLGWVDGAETYTTNPQMQFAEAIVAGLLPLIPCVLLGRRLIAREATQALRGPDGSIRPFVLYLRAFQADAGLHGWLAEQQIANSLRSLGVPVCVGRPGERLPPFGFHRIYFADEDWQTAVATMVIRAACVVLLVADTDGLTWELDFVIKQDWLRKTVFLVPVREHDACRQRLEARYRLKLPAVAEHYAPSITSRQRDLCPVEFPAARREPHPVQVVAQPFVNPLPPMMILDWLFRGMMWVLMKLIPWLQRFRWLTDRSRAPTVNYLATFEPIVLRLGGRPLNWFQRRGLVSPF